MTTADWLAWARGPLFVAALVVMVLGLARVVALNAAALATLIRRSRANGRSIPWGRVLRGTLVALRPVPIGSGARPLFSLASVVFHVGILVVPIGLGAHVMLWERGVGFGWPTLSAATADVLTLVAIGAALLLLVLRLGTSMSRALSRPQDYLVLLLILTPFVSGYLAMHPLVNPWSYDAVMLVHVLSGNLILVLVPFTKISHVALLPLSQLIAELGWHLRPGAGELVALELGKENQPI